MAKYGIKFGNVSKEVTYVIYKVVDSVIMKLYRLEQG